jgi:GNAT superfamily N-acetyltransferase
MRLPMATEIVRAVGKPTALFLWSDAMRLSDQVAEIGERIERTGVRLKDALSVIDMTFDDQLDRLDLSSPYAAFAGLNALMDRAVRGSKVERFHILDGGRRFHALEIHSEEGETLGSLSMLHLTKPISCYYLVYVEIMPPFRRLGLGHKILSAFMQFLKEEGSVGLLDNIIPAEEPGYALYTRLGWRVLADIVEHDQTGEIGTRMVYIPDSVPSKGLEEKLQDLLLKLEKKRAVIDIRDNEDMVRKTIDEFRSIYLALLRLFHEELESGVSQPLMGFMFTRLASKLIGFQRRTSALIGYTGGEAFARISLSEVMDLPMQAYSLWNLEEEDAGVWGDNEVLRCLPSELKEEPTFFIEGLPVYRRPYLQNWLQRRRQGLPEQLKVGDLLDCGFDPTRLREFQHRGVDYIFERISPLFFPVLMSRRSFLRKVEKDLWGNRFCGALVNVNPILLIFRDRGNTYILRRKVEGIHSQEALDQLKSVQRLKDLNSAIGVDRAVKNTVKEIKDSMKKRFGPSLRQEIEDLTIFVPWHIEENSPRLHVDINKVSLGSVWIA